MNLRKINLKLAAVVLLAVAGFVQNGSAQSTIHTLKIKNAKQLHQYFKYNVKTCLSLAGTAEAQLKDIPKTV